MFAWLPVAKPPPAWAANAVKPMLRAAAQEDLVLVFIVYFSFFMFSFLGAVFVAFLVGAAISRPECFGPERFGPKAQLRYLAGGW